MLNSEVERVHVKVMARCRPFNTRELLLCEGQELKTAVVMEGDTVRVLNPDRNFAEREAFQFDHALWSVPDSQVMFHDNAYATQAQVFELTGKPAVESAMEGYHCTLFAYGQTGSGKTYTMLGHEGDEGIAPRLVRHLFASIEESKRVNASERVQFSVELSFLEIYNERVKDLLAIAERNHGRSNQTDTGYAECRVRFHPERGTYVEGLMRLSITDEAHCLAAIKAGMLHRATTSTLMNDTSSRSHAIFQVCLSQKSPLKGTTCVSIMNIVDLAGSERIKLSGATGSALLEARNINLSLSTLRRVIDVLIDNSKLKKGQRPLVPPYRQSLLTWVLSDSLGGNSKTMMIVAVSPYGGNVEDTLSTLRYGLKAKAIVCNARVNEEKTAAVVNMLRTQMEDLRRQLEAKADADQAEQDRLETELKQKETEFFTLQDESRRLDDLKKQYEAELHRKADELHKAHEQMEALQNVEVEREEREKELAAARELQEETSRLLREQEDERKKADAELAAVILRRKSLQRHHDRAAEEEARAKLAAEQARLRQFVSAFQNAFLLGKQRSGLEELQEEHTVLTERLSRLQEDLGNREQQLSAMQDDRSLLQRKVDLLEKRCEAMQRDLEEVLMTKNEKLADLQRQKEESEAELGRVRTESFEKRLQAVRMKQEMEEEQRDANRRYEELQQRLVIVKGELADKQAVLEATNSRHMELTDKLASLDKSSEEVKSRVEEAERENAKKQETLDALQLRRSELIKRREELRDALDKKKLSLRSTQDQLSEVAAEAAAIKKNHAELRQYVSAKFFPTADGSKLKAVQTPGRSIMSPSTTTPMRAHRVGGLTPRSHSRPATTTTPARSAMRGPQGWSATPKGRAPSHGSAQS
jgi:hypothetical protein